MSTQDLNSYIKKSHLKALEKFKADLETFRKETAEVAATLYEDAFTSFTLSDIRVENGQLIYMYDGQEERDYIVIFDEEENTYFEDDIYGLTYTIRFWRSCLRRAKRYWSMSVEQLDAIQDGEADDEEDEEE